MSFKKTSAFIRGAWDGEPDVSDFTQEATVFADPSEFVTYADAGISELIDEYITAGKILQSAKEISADGKVLITTREFDEETSWEAFKDDSRWDTEISVTKKYDVELAPAPEDVNTFDEDNLIYYHSSAHLF